MRIVAALVVMVSLGSASVDNESENSFHSSRVFFEADISKRAYGSFSAEEGQFKFMIFVLIRTKATCSACLVRPGWVLLSAHCMRWIKKPEDLVVIAGKSNLDEYAVEKLYKKGFDNAIDQTKHNLKEALVKKVFIHPEYSRTSFKHDIALLLLKKALQGPRISTVPLSSKQMEKPTLCTVAGWGLKPRDLEPYQLHYVEDKWVGEPETCLPQKDRSYICVEARRLGICEGVSGMPLVCDGRLYGLCSLAYLKTENFTECPIDAKIYFTEVFYHLEWVIFISNTETPAMATGLRSSFPWIAAAFFIIMAAS